MTFGTTTNFNQSRNQIITSALTLLSVFGVEDIIPGSDMINASNILNAMIKHWEADGCYLWKLDEAVLYLNAGQNTYSIGNGANAASVANLVETTTKTTNSIGDSTVTLVTVTGLTVGNIIGIVQSATSVLWTTITAINTGTKVVTLNTTITAATAAGANVYSYPTNATRPWNITQVRYRLSTGYDRELPLLAREDYFALPNKSSTGVPVNYYYDVQLNRADIYLWPTPYTANDEIRFTYVKTIEDFDLAADTADFPQEFILPLIYNLAVLLAPIYGKYDKLQILGPMAISQYKIAKGFNRDTGSVYFVPDIRDND